jgi:hypothetical protein
MLEAHWLAPESVDQRNLFEGKSVLRGQTPQVGELIDTPAPAETMVFK